MWIRNYCINLDTNIFVIDTKDTFLIASILR